MSRKSKPVGGVEWVLLYPADAVETALFSSDGCEVTLSEEALEVVLMEDCSYICEEAKCVGGATKITHSLTLVAERGAASEWLETEFLERASIDGVVAVVTLEDGRSLLVGYSSRFGCDYPLRLVSLCSSSGSSPCERPTLTLQLVSCDTEFSHEII
jgi:hypothetical protein